MYARQGARPLETTRRRWLGAAAGAAVALTAGCSRPPRRVAEGVSYGASRAQHYDVYAPADGAGHRGLAPLVVLIHGGGWVEGSPADVVSTVPHFTGRGYVVANTGSRLAPEAPAPVAAEDVRHAIAAIVGRAREWGADPARLVLAGYSAGAHLALVAALTSAGGAVGGPQAKPRAVVDFWGITDPDDAQGGERLRSIARRWLPADAPGGRPALVAALTPLAQDLSRAPALCALHSIHDDIVPFAHSERLVEAYRRAGRPAQLMRLTHPGHAPARSAYSSLFAEVGGFLTAVGA
ncbi:MAG: alpha/beta hydrolase [Bryobacterales bacterium]|nr:alpha/beta hydrolase [Bryobacterales bacterium]